MGSSDGDYAEDQKNLLTIYCMFPIFRPQGSTSATPNELAKLLQLQFQPNAL